MIKISKIAGVDEVGRGCLAGPVFAAAVILNDKIDRKDINDSKKNRLSQALDNSFISPSVSNATTRTKKVSMDRFEDDKRKI